MHDNYRDCHIAFQTVNFDLNTSAITVPEAPELDFPLENDTTGNQLVFKWSSPDTPTSYHLQVAENPDFNDLIVDRKDITADSYRVDSLESDQVYYWRLRSKNDVGFSAWSDTAHFITGLPGNFPAVPLTLSPSNEDTVAIDVIFSWKGNENSDHFRLQVSDDLIFYNLILDTNNLQDTCFYLENLEYDRKRFLNTRISL